MDAQPYRNKRRKRAMEFLIYRKMEERLQQMDFKHLYNTLAETLGETEELKEARAMIGGVVTDRAKLQLLREEGELSRTLASAHIPVNAEVEIDLFDKQSFYRHGNLLHGVKHDALVTPNRQLRLFANNDVTFTVRDDVSRLGNLRPVAQLSPGDRIVLGTFIDNDNVGVRTLISTMFWGSALRYVNLRTKRYGIMSAPGGQTTDIVAREQNLLVGHVRVAGATMLQ